MSKHVENTSGQTEEVCLFENAQEVWFWFMKSLEARADGAYCARMSGDNMTRPCEPNDIYTIINRLHRTRRLLIDHIRVLTHYGKRGFPPMSDQHREQKAHYIWEEALEILEDVFKQKKLLKPVLTCVS